MFLSYAQNFEDVMLWRALNGVRLGFYIDIGAQHPAIDSVSRAFYDHGWRGIHVEPTSHYASLLRDHRSDELVIQAAVSSSSGLLTLFEIPDTGLSTADEEIAARHRDAGFDVRRVSVPSVTLDDVFECCAGREIHWLKIDVEGLESKVLEGWIHSTSCPWIVLVESTLPLTQIDSHAQWEPLLLKLGYAFAYFDGLNRFYVHSSHADLLDSFSHGPCVFDGFTLNGDASAPFVQKQIAQIEELAKELDDVRAASSANVIDWESRICVAESENLRLRDKLRIARAEAGMLVAQAEASTNAIRQEALSAKDEALNQLAHEREIRTLAEEYARAQAIHLNDQARASVTLVTQQLARTQLQVERLQEEIRSSRLDADARLAEEQGLRQKLHEQAFMSEAALAQAIDEKSQIETHMRKLDASLSERLHEAKTELTQRSEAMCRLEAKLAELNQSSHHWYSHAQTLESKVVELNNSSHHWWGVATNRDQRLGEIYASTSWRITSPMRWLGNRFRPLRRLGWKRRSCPAASSAAPQSEPVVHSQAPTRSVTTDVGGADLPDASNLRIFLYVDHTVQFGANTGLQRVVRQLGRSLLNDGRSVVFVAWDHAGAKLRTVSQEELKHLSSWNGPDISRYAPQEASCGFLDRSSHPASPGSWLVVPEVTHITPTGTAVTADLIRVARSSGLRVCAIFYDAIPLKRAEYSGAAAQHLEYMHQIAKADLVLPISRFAEQDFLLHLKGASLAAQVKALPLPCECTLGPRRKDITSGAGKLILSVGSITPHKNQLALLRVFNAMGNDPAAAGWRLRLIGHMHPDVEKECADLLARNSKIEIWLGASDEELASSYESAAFTVFPSLEEGFGLPIAESLWFGKPCICASFGAMAEFSEFGGILAVDVSDEKSLKRAILELVGDSQKLRHMQAAAVEAKLPTWRDYSTALCGLLRTYDAEVNSQNRSVDRKPRIFWLGMHKVLVRTELARLREIGFEVFNPPYLSDVVDQSAELNWDSKQESSLPRDVFDHLSNTNFFYAALSSKTLELLNEYFDIVLVTISPTWLKPILNGFQGKVVYRVYGQSFDLSAEIQHQGLRDVIVSRDNFELVAHSAEAIADERDWLRKRSRVVPYCLTDDVFGYQDSWVPPSTGVGRVGMSCPNIANPYYRDHYVFLKKNFPAEWFRIYGVQTTVVNDPAVAGTIPRYQLLKEWQNLSCYLYTYGDPHVCYLPPIECMVIGLPVLFPEGSLLDRYFGAERSPGCYRTAAEANELCHRLVGGDTELANRIIVRQRAVRSIYTPSHVWPKFDNYFLQIQTQLRGQ